MSDVTAHVVVMGVAGAGKSTVGELIASELGVVFGEGDDFHSAESIAKMARGESLTDEDRRPWLETIGTWLRAQSGAVVSCSALKLEYRDLLRSAVPDVYFIHLDGDRDVVRNRVATRDAHFMPESLVDSQYDALEPLQAGEAGAVFDFSRPVADIVAASVASLSSASTSEATA